MLVLHTYSTCTLARARTWTRSDLCFTRFHPLGECISLYKLHGDVSPFRVRFFDLIINRLHNFCIFMKKISITACKIPRFSWWMCENRAQIINRVLISDNFLSLRVWLFGQKHPTHLGWVPPASTPRTKNVPQASLLSTNVRKSDSLASFQKTFHFVSCSSIFFCGRQLSHARWSSSQWEN